MNQYSSLVDDSIYSLIEGHKDKKSLGIFNVILYIIMSLALTLLCCSVGKSSAVNILETLKYLEKSFKQNLAAPWAALFWMASILLILWSILITKRQMLAR